MVTKPPGSGRWDITSKANSSASRSARDASALVVTSGEPVFRRHSDMQKVSTRKLESGFAFKECDGDNSLCQFQAQSSIPFTATHGGRVDWDCTVRAQLEVQVGTSGETFTTLAGNLCPEVILPPTYTSMARMCP